MYFLEKLRKIEPVRITLISQILKVCVQLTSIVLFSRIFEPRAIGLFAIVLVVINAAEMLRDFGLSTTGLSSKELSHQDASNLFWLNGGFGIIAAIVVASLSPLTAMLFGIPDLLIIQMILSFNLIVNGFQVQFQVQLARKGNFFSLSWTDVFAQVSGLVLGLASFTSGLGIYALAVQFVSTPLILAISRVVVSRWKPLRARGILKSRHLISSSGNYGAGQVISYLNRNVDNFLIGLIWGPKALGPYARAYQLETIPTISALAPLTNVFVPQLVARKNQGLEVDSLLSKYQIQISLAASFFFCIAATSADAVLPALLGQQWVSASGLFAILAFAGIFEAFNQILYWRFLVYNRSQAFLVYSSISGIFCLTNIAINSFIGVTAVAYAVVVNQCFNWLTAQLVLRASTGLDIWRSFKLGFFAIVASFCSFLLSKASIHYLALTQSNDWIEVIVAVLLPGLFLALIYLLSKEYRDGLVNALALGRENKN